MTERREKKWITNRWKKKIHSFISRQYQFARSINRDSCWVSFFFSALVFLFVQNTEEKKTMAWCCRFMFLISQWTLIIIFDLMHTHKKKLKLYPFVLCAHCNLDKYPGRIRWKERYSSIDEQDLSFRSKLEHSYYETRNGNFNFTNRTIIKISKVLTMYWLLIQMGSSTPKSCITWHIVHGMPKIGVGFRFFFLDNYHINKVGCHAMPFGNYYVINSFYTQKLTIISILAAEWLYG